MKYKINLQTEQEAETPKDLMDSILDDPITFLDSVVITDEKGNEMTFSDIIKE